MNILTVIYNNGEIELKVSVANKFYNRFSLIDSKNIFGFSKLIDINLLKIIMRRS